MKKILLAAALLAVASINSFGAACVSGSTVAQLSALGGCEINGWTLDGWSIGAPSSTGYAPGLLAGNNNPTNNARVTVDFSTTAPDNFFVTFRDTPDDGVNFFSAGIGQRASWNSNFSVFGLPIASVILGVDGAVIDSPLVNNEGNNAQVNVQKIVYDPNNPVPPFLGINAVLYAQDFNSPNPVFVYNNPGNTLDRVSIADGYTINGGSTGTGAVLSSYTNAFFGTIPPPPPPPPTDVPEPITFVLMGAGLVGVAALRRRNG